MSFPLTDTAAFLASQTTKEVIIILEIDGIPTIYGSKDVQKFARIGAEGLLIGNFVIGEAYTPSNTKGLISIKDGTSTNISSQIRIDRSAASSVSTMKIALVDKDNFVSDEMAIGNIVDDILSREANVYLGFQGGAHPEDSVRIFSGNITDFNTKTGLVNLTVSHPDNLKRQSILPQYTAELDGAIDASQTTIPVTTTVGFQVSENELTSYIRIDEEIIQVGGVSGNNFTNCTRAALGTLLSPHDDESELTSFYRLQGSPLDLTLKILNSGEKLADSVESIDAIENTVIKFNDFNIQENQGLAVGDYVSIDGLITNEPILSFEVGNGFSSITIATDLGTPDPTGLQATFKSKYDTLSFGAGLATRQIDVEQFERIQTLFGGGFPDVDLYIKETANVKSLIEDDLLFVIGAVSVPRKGRISITYTSPPLAETGTKTITAKDVVQPNSIEVRRNTNNKFYNTVEYKFDEFSLESTLQRTNRLISGDSLGRIKVNEKELAIEARGFRRDASNFIDTQSRRFIDRYRFGAESFKMEVTYDKGFNSEVGDIVIFDGTGLNMYDSKTNSRETYSPRLLEVTNKSLNVTQGRVTLELTDTAFELDGRYAVIGPSSKVVAATTTTLDLAPLLTISDEVQRQKWTEFVGSPVRVHSPDFSDDETVTITGFDPVVTERMIVSPALSFTPGANYIVTMPSYDESNDLYKLLHGHMNPIVPIVSGASSTQFDVSGADVGSFFVGSIVDIHNEDYSVRAEETTVTDITGTTITVADDLGFTPDNTFVIDLIGFSSDEGVPYRFI